MQDDHGVDNSRKARRGRLDADASAWTGLGLIVIIASLVIVRFLPGGILATVVGFIALVPFGVAVVIAIRRRVVRALLLPLAMFVLTGILCAVRVI